MTIFPILFLVCPILLGIAFGWLVSNDLFGTSQTCDNRGNTSRITPRPYWQLPEYRRRHWRTSWGSGGGYEKVAIISRMERAERERVALLNTLPT